MKKFLLGFVFCVCLCNGMEPGLRDQGKGERLLAGEHDGKEKKRFRRIVVTDVDGRHTCWEIVGRAKQGETSFFKIQIARKKE